MQITINVQLPINNDKDYQLVHNYDKDDSDNIFDFLVEIQEDAYEVVSGQTYADWDYSWGTGILSPQDAMEATTECIVYVSIEDEDGERYDWTACEIQDMFRNYSDYLTSKEAFRKMVLRYNR